MKTRKNKSKTPVRRLRQRAKQRTSPPKRRRRPAQVYKAIRNLQNAARHIIARGVELEGALDSLREEERLRLLRELLQALRESPSGNLIRQRPDSPKVEGEDQAARMLVQTLSETFKLDPVGVVGERITVREDEVGRRVDLDREWQFARGRPAQFEVTAVGWKRNDRLLIRPTVRPVSDEASGSV